MKCHLVWYTLLMLMTELLGLFFRQVRADGHGNILHMGMAFPACSKCSYIIFSVTVKNRYDSFSAPFSPSYLPALSSSSPESKKLSGDVMGQMLMQVKMFLNLSWSYIYLHLSLNCSSFESVEYRKGVPQVLSCSPPLLPGKNSDSSET